MALSTQGASSLSLALAESTPRWDFDVSSSFRGEDTRWGFISHLYHQLQLWLVFKTSKDNRQLESRADISPELLSAIEHSRLAIVVLSPNYASSTWCLEELAKIMESMGAGDKRILPVSYNVDPSDIRHQRTSFAKAFAKHGERYSAEKVESSFSKKWPISHDGMPRITSKHYNLEKLYCGPGSYARWWSEPKILTRDFL